MANANENDRIPGHDREQPEGWFDPESYRQDRQANDGNQNSHAGNPRSNERYENIQQSQVRNQYRNRDEYNRQFGNSANERNSGYGDMDVSRSRNQDNNTQYGDWYNTSQDNPGQSHRNYEHPDRKVPYGDRFDGQGGRMNDAARSNQAFRNNSDEKYRAYPGQEGSNDRDRDWWDKASDEVASWFGNDEAERRRRTDKREGPHRGKGPKGYSRTDDRIREDINERLYHDSHVDASEVEIKVENGEAVISGAVDSREAKRRIEDIAESIPGVRDVENRLKVNRPGNPSAGYDRNGTIV